MIDHVPWAGVYPPHPIGLGHDESKWEISDIDIPNLAGERKVALQQRQAAASERGVSRERKH